jgi:hypothetical protein
MLASIHPLGERGRHNRWWLTVIAYLLASTGGGLVAGALAGLVGTATRLAGLHTGAGVALAGALALAAAGLEAGHVPTWRLSPRRQVDEDWLHRYRGWVYGAGFGFQLGLGVVTIVATPAVHLTLALAALTGSVAGGCVVGAVFGLVRALPVVGMRWVVDPGQLWRLHRRLAAAAPAAQRAAGAALAVIAVAVVSRHG